ncbi:MAG: hypoxanthine phosphoribosyltransferase [Armatimonadota bacterium]|nr:MAG: hypoxanthine phosphoribosyltransferase [Armatimonadota bacterium]
MDNDVKEVLLSAEQIQARVKEMAQQIATDYRGREPVLVGVLDGAVVFLADLMRALPIAVRVDFVKWSSYGDATVSSGEVQVLKDLGSSIEGKHVLVVEDIVDTGLTLRYLLENFENRSVASLAVAALLDKPSRRKVDVKLDYVGFQVPDEFVVGYGLDLAQRYRNLPYVAVLKPEVYRGS